MEKVGLNHVQIIEHCTHLYSYSTECHEINVDIKISSVMQQGLA
jgi:hypothetical protein